MTCRSAHHCACPECRRAAREYEYWRAGHKRRGRELLVDATGCHRRIRALQRIGWSSRMIAEHAGYSDAWVLSIIGSAKVRPPTRAVVVAVYDDLSMRLPRAVTPRERAAVTKTRRYAEKAGWPPPLAYDDDHIDDPTVDPAEAAP